jgi:hypothetical protein
MKSIAIPLGLIASVLVALSLFARAQDEPASEASGWEHLALSSDANGGLNDPETSATINRLGSEGWELVDVEAFNEGGNTHKTVYFFKRPL